MVDNSGIKYAFLVDIDEKMNHSHESIDGSKNDPALEHKLYYIYY